MSKLARVAFACLSFGLVACGAGNAGSNVMNEVVGAEAGASASVDAAEVVTTYMGKAYIFSRSPGAGFRDLRFGHIGFGYEIWTYRNGEFASAEYHMGAVENPGGMPVVLPEIFVLNRRIVGDNGAWFDGDGVDADGDGVVDNPVPTSNEGIFAAMRKRGYTSYIFSAAFFPVSKEAKDAVQAIHDGLKKRGYNVIGNNCLDATFEILSTLGAPNLINPNDLAIPSNWFTAHLHLSGWSDSKRL